MSNNLMITHGGALGDNVFTIPTLRELRKRYCKLYLFCLPQGATALEATGLIDRFVVHPRIWPDATKEQQRVMLLVAMEGIEFEESLSFNGVLPHRYMYHPQDPLYKKPTKWKRKQAEGVSFFDIFAERAQMPEAVGQRPLIKLSHAEHSWLRDFRHIHHIPKNAFLLGWQFTGSVPIKWYPFFREVIQENIMQRYDEVYVIGLGDMKNLLRWDKRYHGGRFINLGDSVSFRQAAVLAGILDCLVGPETGIMVYAQAWENVPKILLATHTYGEHITFPETVIIQSSAVCSPCYNIEYVCYRHGKNPWSLCMGSIRPERVIEEIEKVIERHR